MDNSLSRGKLKKKKFKAFFSHPREVNVNILHFKGDECFILNYWGGECNNQKPYRKSVQFSSYNKIAIRGDVDNNLSGG